ncbi:MAG: amidohydrolase family protein [Alphaproteobacteria bacterium]|nr:amidohydrolase family protein [Alphaproteobacteria bacterium]
MAFQFSVYGACAILIGVCLHATSAQASKAPLSPAAQALIDKAFDGLQSLELVDYHVHMLGLGSGDTGARVNPNLLSWIHPVSRLKAKIFFKSAGITDEAKADPQYVERLLALSRAFPKPTKLAILGFDYSRGKDGSIDRAKTEIYVPADYVVELARRHPDSFVPVVSVHPYDPEALAKLEAYARQGVQMVKWLPNAQGMDPSDPDIDPYYQTMARLGLTLLCHVGQESAVHAPDAQRLGNPLLLRRALDNGVRVIMAHAGNRGSNEDLDRPGHSARNFDLFLRMMDDPRYKDLLLADISALTQTIRDPEDINVLLSRSDLHARLVNGSDYPLPAIPFFISTASLAWNGLISWKESRALHEIYRQNPLLFDFVLKRTLRHPQTGAQFPPQIFGAHPTLARNNQTLQDRVQSETGA